MEFLCGLLSVEVISWTNLHRITFATRLQSSFAPSSAKVVNRKWPVTSRVTNSASYQNRGPTQLIKGSGTD